MTSQTMVKQKIATYFYVWHPNQGNVSISWRSPICYWKIVGCNVKFLLVFMYAKLKQRCFWVSSDEKDIHGNRRGQKFIRKNHASTSQTSSCFRLPDTFKLDSSFNYNLEPHKCSLTIPYLHRDYTALASVANSSREQLEMPK